ncbi:MAG: colicin E3/pyocin S6 family cytotoxin [Elsteraceae bacterium]
MVTRHAIPSPSILDHLEKHKVVGDRQVWRNRRGDRLYTWDSLHGEVEVFNGRGFHLGAVDPLSGLMIKEAVRGRRIEGL